jgi:AmmeMemoRadiSam system protein A
MSSPLHNPSPDASLGQSSGSAIEEFSREERTLLLRLAHDAIESALDRRNISMEPPSAHMAQLRGVFSTLYLDRQLRGCVGYVFPVAPLYRGVIETARSASSEDTRFRSVTREEAPYLKVSLSVLSTLNPIEPEQVEIGRHGLVVSLAGHRGLLLPQVPVEHEWDRDTFLEQTCRKAGLPMDAWKLGATLEAFTAEVFGEEGAH